jgi:hypothetical protein
MNMAGVQQHDAAPKGREFMLDFEIAKRIVLGKNAFEQFPQTGDVPLPVSQIVNVTAYRIVGRHLKIAIERLVGKLHAEGLIQHDKRMAHGGNDVLCVNEAGAQGAILRVQRLVRIRFVGGRR